jgi:hypothetical protein
VSTLYLVALVGVAIALLVTVIDAVASVSRRVTWQHARFAVRLSVVDTADMRDSQLPYVGSDRRVSAFGADATVQAGRLRA